MDLWRWFRVLAKVGFSVVGAGVFYFLWLAAFLSLNVHQTGSHLVRVAGLLSASIITAGGFAVGAAIMEPLAQRRLAGFLRILAWPLVACVVGAAVVYPVGPMLIVFGMFGAGTASMLLRELLPVRRKNHLP